MHALLTLGFLGAFGLLWLIGKQYKPGESPFERLPATLAADGRSKVETQTAPSGRRYVLSSWAPGADGRTFHVAELKGRPAWISFWRDGSGAKSLYLSLASSGELNEMRKDFGV